LIIVVSLFGCNNASDGEESNAPIEEISNDISDVTEEPSGMIFDNVPPPKWISLYSPKEELPKIREMLYCTDEQTFRDYLHSLYIYDTNGRERLLTFLDRVDSVPYIKIYDEEITMIDYQESTISSNKTFQVGTTNENGDAVDFLYYLNAEEIEDPMAFAAEAGTHRGGSLFDEPKESQDKRLSIVSEQRENFLIHGLENGIEWWGVLDGMAIRIVYNSENAENIKIEDVLNSLTITTIPKSDPVAPELIEQITEGMTYKEVKEIIGALQKDISSENIVFEYYLSDGRAAQIEFQKLNETDDLNDFAVKSITIE
jgi:hypothetical protein